MKSERPLSLPEGFFDFESKWDEPQGIIHGKKEKLRVIKTARSIRAMNDAVQAGFFPLVKPVIQNPEIRGCERVHQDPVTGLVELQGDLRNLPKSEAVTDFIPYYPYRFSRPYAAYLVPKNLKRGQTVWLEDVIQDIVASRGPQFFVGRLGACAAIWNGADFVIQFNPEVDIPLVVG